MVIFAINLQNMNITDLKRILSKYFKDKPVIKAWVFGSYSRNEETERSDVDILVDLDPSAKVGLGFFGKSLASFAYNEVEKDKVLVYERGS